MTVATVTATVLFHHILRPTSCATKKQHGIAEVAVVASGDSVLEEL